MTRETKMMTTGNTPANTSRDTIADIMATFEAYKLANDQRLAEIEKKGAADTVLEDKLRRLDKRLDTLSLKAACPDGPAQSAQPETAPDRAWTHYLRHGDERGLERLDTKALSTATDAAGGYTAPPELDRLIEVRLTQSSPMRQIASVRQTSAGVYRKPVSLGISAAWVGESDNRREATTTGLKLLEFPAGELYAMPAATQTLLDDTYADIDEWLADEAAAVFSAQESAAFVTGNGANKPKGFLDYAVIDNGSHVWGKIGSVAGNFKLPGAADQLINLIYAPGTQFRANGRFVMNRRTAASVRKLKDKDGRYIWMPGVNGQETSLLGYPLTELEDMPDIATNKSAIAFGDFRRGYLIVDRQGMRVLRDPFSKKPYVLFYTTKRVGGGLQNFDAIKVMRF